MSSPASRWWPIPLAALLLVGAGVAAYVLWPQPRPAEPQPVPVPVPADLAAALAANTRGVGRMERYEYPEAEKEFAEAARSAPDWLPAQVNLGIAQFNQDTPESLARARAAFAAVLAKDPVSRHARYCLGIIASERGPFAEAYPHFLAVHALDPADPHTLLRLGLTHPGGKNSDGAREHFEKALARNPYLNAARYNLAMALRTTDLERATQLLEEKKLLTDAEWEVESGTRYGEMGKYADVIGRVPATQPPAVGPLPLFGPDSAKVALAAGARWAVAADLDPTRKAARARFGGTVVLLDFNGDARPDVFLASAVVEGGKVRDLLLRNDGAGAFTDVTAAAGLGTPRPSLGAAAGDYDNDGRPDVVVTGAGEQHLFRNRGDGTFEDVSAAAGLDQLKAVCLGCGWTDIDQDGDLDLLVCKYAGGATAEFDGAKPGGGIDLLENVGVAPPGPAAEPPPALSTAFRPFARFADAAPTSSVVAFAAADLDSDRDADLFVTPELAAPSVVENDRLMRLRRVAPPWAADKSRWNGSLVLDANHDERSDLFLVRTDGPPVYLLSKGERDFTPGSTNSPILKQATTADVDMDGWPDVVGLGVDGKPLLLHNQGDGRLQLTSSAFGNLDSARAVTAADLDGDGAPDLLTWGEAGLRFHRSLGNGNSAVRISPSGRRDKGANLRTNSDGLGAWVVAQSGSHWTGAERTTAAAGLGQSLLPTSLGIGKAGRADVVRVRWPDAVIQAELGVSADAVFRFSETNRKGTSCPVLMAWDGERFAFVTDFLGGGALGESGPDGSVRPPRPEESVKIEPRQLAAKDGHLVLKIAEPMDEVLYLDHLRLDVVDHPAGTAVYPDERFTTSGPLPSQALLAFRGKHFPKSATDHSGRDVTPRVLDRDRRAVDGFATRSWLGYAEDHSLTLDFGELPAADGRKWFLVLAGWTEYPYPESMYAATRAGVELSPPVLERFDAAAGKWQSVCDLGFPAGLPRVMTRELPAVTGPVRLRIRTNMQVYWDQVYLAAAADAAAVGKVTSLDVAGANLAARGFMQEVYPGGRPPVAYDDAKTEPVAVNRWKGNLTRLGDVTDLLRAGDDRFVVCGPGDEVTVRFDAKGLPALPAGWERSFVLRSRGYCKDTSVTTVSGGTVGPLPFRAMSNYPDFGAAVPPTTDAARWNTRPAGGR